ncbi:ACT-like tyrosine kinase family protein [Trifolium medium]|uniref:ACT-like tyrosine kinase family protein n=1 Tax=Trifolium medium TaxID=97028 RepID=A0A392NMS2_9FABA|nr:ACT-like tyrosine kinase family protein [Trifolium medium]
MVTVAMEDNESCGSGVHHRTSSSSSIPGQSRHHRQKLEVYNEILRRLNDSGNEEAMQPGFSDQLWAHFNRLPSRSFPRIFSSHLHNYLFRAFILLWIHFVLSVNLSSGID